MDVHSLGRTPPVDVIRLNHFRYCMGGGGVIYSVLPLEVTEALSKLTALVSTIDVLSESHLLGFNFHF